MVDTWLLSFESGPDGAAPVEVRPGLQEEAGPDTVPPAAAMRDSSSSVRPCLAKGAGSTPRRVNLSANEAKQRRAPSETWSTEPGQRREAFTYITAAPSVPTYLVVLVFEKAGQRLDTGL